MTTPSAHHESHQKIGDFLKEAVFGLNDGVVSTFAVVAGLTGGVIENKTILLAALATLVAGGFSMGLGTYLGSKAEKEHYESERKRELYEMDHMPEIERQEIRDIYAAKGFTGKLLEDVVEKITSDPKIWLDTMMRDELGFSQAPPKPGLNGLVMSAAFVTGALMPTLPYFFAAYGSRSIFVFSLVASTVALLVAGSLKTRFTKRNVFLSALETLLVGALAAGASYGIGVLIG